MPLLSIIIPTKDRYDTLIPVVQTLLSYIPGYDYEIVIQDNSTAKSMQSDLILLFNDARVKYFYCPERMSIVENTVTAIKNAIGDYLCFIGDDDLVAPYIIEETQKLRSSGLDCLIHPPAYYWWSTVEFKKIDRYRHKSAFWLPKLSTTELLNGPKELKHLLHNGAISYYQMPRFYHGIVSRRALQAIYKHTGTFVPGSSPDMALSIALSMVMECYLKSNRPITVFGASRGSGGGLTAERIHHGRIQDQKHLPKYTMENWHFRLPKYWSEYTIYPQTTMEVLKAFGRPNRLNFIALYASIKVNEPWLWSMTWPLTKSYLRLSPNRWLSFATFITKRYIGKLFRETQSLFGLRPFDVIDCFSLDDCMKELNRRYG